MNNPIERYDERLAPSRWWYGLAVIIAIGGFVAMGAFLMARLPQLNSESHRILAPGNEEITLAQPGKYTIYHESRSMLNGKVYISPFIFGLNIKLTSLETGAEVPLGPTRMNSTYRVGGRVGKSIMGFKIDKPGRYQVATSFDDGHTEPRTVLAIGQGFGIKLIVTILGALGLASGGIILAVIVATSISRSRRRSMEQQV
ncbi:MAG: hypothetical protein P8Y47_01715 [Alphaproteobacteria bacterium]